MRLDLGSSTAMRFMASADFFTPSLHVNTDSSMSRARGNCPYRKGTSGPQSLMRPRGKLLSFSPSSASLTLAYGVIASAMNS
ncbi:MAG: hypothetical protein LR120_08940 [Dehalococcoidia bacterium]|nr:hypothetical protein [Dehalococcoidia bacterium]